MEKVKEFLCRHRLWFGWRLAVAVCILAAAWVHYDLASSVSDQPVYEIINDDYSRTIEIPTKTEEQTEILTQTIHLSAGQTLYGVRLDVTTYNHAFSTGTMAVELYSTDGRKLARGELLCAELRDNTFETFVFSQPYTPEQDETLLLYLWTGAIGGLDEGCKVGIWASDAQVDEMALCDENGSLNATIALQYVADYSGNWSGRVLLIPAVLILAAVAVGFWLLLGRKARPVLAMLICGGLLGAAFTVVTPSLVAPDEYTHLAVAYQYAGRLLGQPVLSEDGTLLVRACDAPYFGDRTGDIGIFAYKTMGGKALPNRAAVCRIPAPRFRWT